MKQILHFLLITGVCAILTYAVTGCCSAPRREYKNNWVWHPDMTGTSNW